MISKEFLERVLAPQHSLSNTELETLWLAIEGNSIGAIATQVGSTPEAIRKRLGKVYEKFEIPGSGPGKLAKLQQHLYQEQEIAQKKGYYTNQPKISDEIPSYGDFYGREEEIQTLKSWILDKRYRLVTLVGMGGMGKTCLAAKFAREVRSQFDRVIWRSLRPSLPPETFLQELLDSEFSKRSLHAAPQAQSLPELILELVHNLRQNRCLLVIDDLETILKEGVAGQYKTEFAGYKDIWEEVAKIPHLSSILLLTSESPKDISLLELENLPVQRLKLDGLSAIAAKELLQTKKLSGSYQLEQLEQLIQLYEGNPLVLKIISGKIQEFFNGDVANFMSHNTIIVQDVSQIIDEVFYRLSDSEKQVMYSLAIQQKPVSIEGLIENIFPTPEIGKLVDSLESLEERSLIDKHRKSTGSVFNLQEVILTYTTQKIVAIVFEEIRTEKLNLMKQHKLISDRQNGNDVIGNLEPNYVFNKIIEEISKKIYLIPEIALNIHKIADKSNFIGYSQENINLLTRAIANFYKLPT